MTATTKLLETNQIVERHLPNGRFRSLSELFSRLWRECAAKAELRDGQMTSNNSLERTMGHRGRAVLAMDGVLADAELAARLAAQFNRYALRGANRSES